MDDRITTNPGPSTTTDQRITANPGLFGPSTPAPADAPPSVRKKGGSPLPYIVAAIVLVAVVAVIAWVTQFTPRKSPPPPAGGSQIDLRFVFTQAIWDKKDPTYAREYERGVEGHFDFPFQNFAAEPAELGLDKTSCDCAHVDVAFPPSAEWDRYAEQLVRDPWNASAGDWNWTRLELHKTRGIVVPAGAKGLVRLSWKGRRELGDRLRLRIQLWAQPEGNSRDRELPNLEVPIVMALPVSAAPQRVHVGMVGPKEDGRTEFLLWSATRAALDLQVDPKHNDPLMKVELVAVPNDDLPAWEEKLRKDASVNSRIQVAYRALVTIKEQVGAKRLPQGGFYKTVPILFDGEKLPGGELLIQGSVKTEIEVVGAEDNGKFNLKTFQAKEGLTKTVSIWAPKDAPLAYESHEPLFLKVGKLVQKETKGARTRWEMELHVPPGNGPEGFLESSAIILSLQSTPPRQVRIELLAR